MENYKDYRLALKCAKQNLPMTDDLWNLLEELVDKAEKEKIIIGSVGWTTKSNPEWECHDVYMCPTCKEYLEDEVINYSYCPYCGQALDVSDIPYDD